jgi:NADPH-dependent glutamate synthase beta subunit-like oxidoreductase/2,4-dienoyl-CoA reductase-like NADH-dependent reductase (Old Yellow Enzyme family)
MEAMGMERRSLFEPITIGSIKIKNRIAMTPVCLDYNDRGRITEQMKAFYVARAKGGVGLFIPGTITVSKVVSARRVASGFEMMDHSFKPELANFAEALHMFGAKVFFQISFGFGQQSGSRAQWPDPTVEPIAISAGQQRMLPKSLPRKSIEWYKKRGLDTPLATHSDVMPREATIEEIEEIENSTALGSTTLKALGYDGMEIHCGHGYFGGETLSALRNKRTDMYGGSLGKRMTFLKNIYLKTREKVGTDFAIGMRISIDERVPGGQTLEDTKFICQEMERLGIDYISLTDGCHEAWYYTEPDESGTMLDGAAEIKKLVRIPVITPSVNDPSMAEKAIAEGKTDMIAMVRGLIADPNWANKAAEGKRVIECIKCNAGCWGRLWQGLPIRCTVNPEVGFEQYNPEYHIKPAWRTPPCNAACPAGTNVQEMVYLISEGRLKEAIEVIRETNPLPVICGRVCRHPCEKECLRGRVEDPVSIAALERLAGDLESSQEEEITPAPRRKKEKVAIIGSGPAGLTAAYNLATLGYGITIFEALSVAGGMLAVGIPEYRLPKKVLQTQIEVIKRLGVEIKLNRRLGKGLTINTLWRQGYKAIFLATGAHSSTKLNIPGEKLNGICGGVFFLMNVNLGKKVKVGNKVAIIGGGNAAIDSARAALRLGAKEVFMVYRRSRDEMPAYPEEIAEAEKEGAKIHFLAAPIRILGKGGKVVGMECIRMELGEPDASGRRQPIPNKGSNFVVGAGTIVTAIGESPDLSFVPKKSKFKMTSRGTLEVDPVNLATNVPGVFAGGDVVHGPAMAVEAIAAGKKAAASIDCYLQGKSFQLGKEVPPVVTYEEVMSLGAKEGEKKTRVLMPTLSLEERSLGFKEVNLGFNKEMAIEEAGRCLHCSARFWPIFGRTTKGAK